MSLGKLWSFPPEWSMGYIVVEQVVSDIEILEAREHVFEVGGQFLDAVAMEGEFLEFGQFFKKMQVGQQISYGSG